MPLHGQSSLPSNDPLPGKQPLTRQQRTILEAILFFLRKGELPTVREVGALVGLRSPATVLKHLRTLERQKLISLTGKSRGIRLVHPELVKEATKEITKEIPSEVLPRAKSVTSSVTSSMKSSVKSPPGLPLVGAIAAGKPFESYSDGFLSDGFLSDGFLSDGLLSTEIPAEKIPTEIPAIPIDPQMFAESGDLFALRVEGDSMINAGILHGDYVIIRRQNRVEEGEIAAVLVNGEGTLKRWHTHSQEGTKSVSLDPANERFDPIVISEDDAKDVLVFGKYVGLVRGNLKI